MVYNSIIKKSICLGKLAEASNGKDGSVMRRKVVCMVSLALCVSVLAGVCAFAAPGYLSPGASGNSNSLISVKRPASGSAVTTSKSYSVSTAGRQGVEVTIFRKSNYDNNFYPVYQGGYLLSGTIGPSGVYVVSIQLMEGPNKIRVYAENQNEKQIITIDLTRITKSQLDRINGMSVGDVFSI